MDEFFYHPFWEFTGELSQDFRNFLSPYSLTALGLSLGVGDGRIQRGNQVFAATVAAGISVVAVSLKKKGP